MRIQHQESDLDKFIIMIQSNNKWYYDIEENVSYDQKTGDLAPKSVQSY